MRHPARRPFADARKKTPRSQSGRRSGYDPSQARGSDGKWIPTGERLKAAAAAPPATIVHVDLGPVRKPAAISADVAVDVRGFRHSISNQALKHIRNRHPDLTQLDLERLPMVLATGTATLAVRRGVNGVPRVEYRATVDGQRYEYVGEVRRRTRRIDAITFYRVGK